MSVVSILPAAFLFGILPQLIQKEGDIDESNDARNAVQNPAFVHDIVEQYDYVIVGAGSAGAVVANRLSKDKNIRVLILQDGGNPNPFVEIPGLANEVRLQPRTDYSYKIVKQKNSCLAENAYNTNCVINRGIGLGGTSNLYSMSVSHGNGRDYDQWAELTQDSKWAYSNVLKVFKKLEDYNGYYQPTDPDVHGQGGESYVSGQEPAVFPPYFYDACAELGLPTIDPNGNQSVGCGHLDVNVKKGIRWGSYKAFLEPILQRSNLQIYRYSKVTKIKFNSKMRATGVNYVRHGVKRRVNAKYEVIVCAGVIDSPKLLMLSGIGPTDVLRSVGIKQLLSLPVGITLHEHVGVNVEFTVNRSKIAFIPQRDLNHEIEAEYRRGGGPLASPFFNPRAIVFTASKEFNDPLWPDIEILPRAQYTNTSLGNGRFLDKIFLQVFLMRPLSSGYLALASSDPYDPPIINPQFFSNESDLRRLTEGLQFGIKMLETTKPFRQIDSKIIPIPACEHLKRKKYLECVIRQNTFLLCHPVGTVKMGAYNDPSAVLDSRLRVRGTQGLRVIDSSIMPTIPNGHTHTPTLMIAEIGARYILSARNRH